MTLFYDVGITVEASSGAVKQDRAGPPDPVPAWHEMVMSGQMSAAEREEFLAGVQAGVLSAALGTTGRMLAATSASRSPGRENVAFRMRPEYWLSQDQPSSMISRQ
jgi:hypothetical protein